jgi:ubiquinone/menaquinone biosynthesis C-methylase UbiE
MKELIEHYDALIDENIDPVYDPAPLKEYMDKWDGKRFVDSMKLSKTCDVLEIGVGTGRLAVRIYDKCNAFWGIDISPKTIDRAIMNLSNYKTVSLICADFLVYSFDRKFDVIYSSLTFIHIQDKQAAVDKVATLLKENGRFVLSLSKSQERNLDYGNREIKLYPITIDEIKVIFTKSTLAIVELYETEFAFVMVAVYPVV